MVDLNSFGFSGPGQNPDNSVLKKLERTNRKKVERANLKGRPNRRYVPLLQVMADGRLWTRPALRAALAGRWNYDRVKGALVPAWRRGLVDRHANPAFNGEDPQALARVMGRVDLIKGQGGNRAARYAYRITELGRGMLEASGGMGGTGGTGGADQGKKKPADA